MLTITVGTRLVESFNEVTQEFTETIELGTGPVLQLEHSLVSLSKWESKFEKPFLSQEDKTEEELFFYLHCMLVEGELSPEVLAQVSDHDIATIYAYIDAKMTATTFFDPPGAPRTRETITSELVYYWMVGLEIPFECQHWHLNRLFTLIRICNIKQAKPEKRSPQQVAAERRALNAKRRADMNTKG